MLNIETATGLATSAVTVLAPLLQQAMDKGVQEFGKSSGGVLFDKLKKRLTHSATKEALDDLAKQPADTAAQGALNMQLRKALASDPKLGAFLQQWVDESSLKAGITQTANTHGDHNKTIQIAGSGNSVS